MYQTGRLGEEDNLNYRAKIHDSGFFKYILWLYLYDTRTDVSFLDPLGDEMFQRQCTAAVDVRHERDKFLGDGEAPRALRLVVALQVHVAVRTLYCFTFILGL